MAAPLGLARLWSALRPYIDLICSSGPATSTHTHTSLLPTAGCWCRRAAALLSSALLSVPFAWLLWGWVRALPSRHVTPSPLLLSAYSFSPPSRAVLFLKTWLSKFIPLLWRRDALCLNLRGGVFEELQRAESSFVHFCSLHLHHRTNNPSLTPLFISLHPFQGLEREQIEEGSEACVSSGAETKTFALLVILALCILTLICSQ